MKLENIKDARGYAKNPENKSIISVDNDSLKAYKEKRLREKNKDDDINRLRKEVQELKDLVMIMIDRDC